MSIFSTEKWLKFVTNFDVLKSKLSFDKWFFFQRKCDLYWPKAKEETETYGFVEVTLESEEVMANYTVRTMKIKHLKVSRKKIT